MSVPSNLNKHVYDGNGVTTSWPFTYPVILSTDIEVILTNVAGVDQAALNPSLYTIDVSAGTVTYPLTGSPLATGWKITLLRVEPLTQLTTLTTQGAFTAQNIERALDKLTMITQQHDEALSRTISYPVSQTPSSTDTTLFLATVLGYKTDAAASATAASTSASTASTSATAAASSATAASASATAAAASAAGVTPGVTVKTTDFTITSSEFGQMMVMNSASAHTFTLPAIGSNKAIIYFKNIGTGLLTLAKTGTDTIETTKLGTNEEATLIADVTNAVWRDASRKASRQGADVASATTTTLGDDGDFFNITGTTTITSITAKAAGKIVRLQFNSALTLTNGSNLKLNGDMLTAAQATITLASDGTNWYELSRSNDSANIVTINLVVDGGGAALTTGVKLDFVTDFAGTILQVTTLADQSGSVVFDIWKDTYANYPPTVADTITASAKPTLSSATKAQDSTLTGWTTSFSKGDTWRINVDSITTVTRVLLSLKVRKK